MLNIIQSLIVYRYRLPLNNVMGQNVGQTI